MVLSDSRISELRMRKRAVCVRAGRGICRLDVLVLRKLLSQALETGRCLVWRRFAESCSWRVDILIWLSGIKGKVFYKRPSL